MPKCNFCKKELKNYYTGLKTGDTYSYFAYMCSNCADLYKRIERENKINPDITAHILTFIYTFGKEIVLEDIKK